MLVAFAIAGIVGLAAFLIWWLTMPGIRQAPESASSGTRPVEAGQPPSPEARIEVTLPRGGSLTGSTDMPSLAAERLTGATLVRLNRATDEIEPGLAESWTASPDHLVFALKIRAGLKWPDGRPFTAHDVITSQRPIHVFDTPVAIRAIDAQTLEATFPQPFAPGLRLFAFHPIQGLGPFVPAGKNAFARNPHYWRTAGDKQPLPYLDEIVLVEGRPGEHDFADTGVRAEDFEAIKQLEAAGKARLFNLGPGLDADAMWIRPGEDPREENDRPWLTNEKFRLAISTAVDRGEYCKQVFYGACAPAGGPVSPANFAWFNPDLPIGRGDPALARAMLEELGLRDRTGDGILNDAARRPVRISLAIRNDVPSAARAAEFIAASLKSVGVQVDVTPLTAAALAARRQKGNYDAIYDRIEMRDTDPAMNLDFWLSSGAAHPWAAGARTSPPADWERQLDQLMLKHAASFDRIERLQSFVDAQKLYQQHMPAIFFGVPHVRVVTSMRTLNATPSLLRPHLLWNAEALAVLK